MEKEEVNAARVNAIKGLQYLLPVAAAFVCLGGREGSAFGCVILILLHGTRIGAVFGLTLLTP